MKTTLQGNRLRNRMEEVLLEATGINGKLLLFRNIVRIQRFGVSSFLKGTSRVERDIVISQIRSIEFGKAGLLNNGYIEFDIMQQGDRDGSDPGTGFRDCTVTFKPKQQRVFEAFRTALEERLHGGPGRTSTAATSHLDELDKLASLRDRGVITEEEFSQKKRGLLGL